MALQLAAAPFIAGALRSLPMVSAAAAGIPSLLQGRPLEALTSAGLAYGGGKLLQGGVYNPAVARVAQMAGTRLGINPTNLAGVTALGLGSFVPQIAQGFGGGAVRAATSVVAPTASTAAALRGGIPGGPAQYDLSGLPPGMDPTFGYGLPYGTPAQIMDPRGLAAGARLGMEKLAESQLKIMRRQNEERFKAAEARSKTELQRQLAAANIRQNIDTAARQLLGAQASAQQMGETASQQAGQALISQYQYQ